jgi:N-carbamoyl-L-amino-acid hydrolase
VPIGIVTRNWGAAKIDVSFKGEQAHTGPAKMGARRDALFAAAQLICDVRAIADKWPDRIHTSVGRLVVQPNSPNVVPSQTDLSIELRAVDDSILQEAEIIAMQAIDTAAQRANVAVEIGNRTSRSIRVLPPAVGELVKRCALEAGVRSREIDTVSGHDALSLLDTCPTGLVFVPSVGGIAHNEKEDTHSDDLDTGMTVLIRHMWKLPSVRSLRGRADRSATKPRLRLSCRRCIAVYRANVFAWASVTRHPRSSSRSCIGISRKR